MAILFKISKWFHKYLGLVLILFLMWMSVSGILMNHPTLISNISVPRWLVPPQYPINNWNRSALTHLMYSQEDSLTAYAGGKQGVWKSEDGGNTFRLLSDGFPQSPYYRKTAHIFLWEGERPQLFAATNNGLFSCDLLSERWREIPLGEHAEPLKKMLQLGDSLVVFSQSQAYVSPFPPQKLNFTRLPLMRPPAELRVSLVRLFFDLHDGKVWGLAGKLLFDVAGVILFFLSISAFYAWYYPWKRRRENSRGYAQGSKPLRRLFKWFLKYHLKLGMWAAVILLIMGGTGLFMRPPLLVALANGSVPASWYPGSLPDNPWDHKIHNALYDAVSQRIVIQATDGLWAGPSDFQHPFEPLDLQVPIFVMGATVFEAPGRAGYLVGSFNGLFHWERTTGKSTDVLTGEGVENVSTMRPAEKMVTGYLKTPSGKAYINTHRQGILAVQGESEVPFAMPDELLNNYRMPLWNYLFEIHNGRFFEDLIGKWYILLVPLGSLFFVLIILSGVFDWLYLNLWRKSQMPHPK